MILSVIIINFNVRFFLEQCLSSLKKALDAMGLPQSQTEVIIIDNASTDGSLEFLIPLFPGFRFYQNLKNTGFAKANNQALTFCSGEFILFLNPDTILAEDTLAVCLDFLKSHLDAGALGVQMIDGAGHFLRESKRGFPTPSASFFKMTGFTRLFPSSKVFSAYYMGHLDNASPNSVEVLSGAFMMVRRHVLDITGHFDEQFFMYAEDIDLSYRIRLAGFRNYYLPETTIIHFKGESTKKDLRYINMFYEAMILFMEKHFYGKRTDIRLAFLKSAVRLRQTLASLRIPFSPIHKRSEKRLRVFVDAPDSDCGILLSKLKNKNIPLAVDENSAQEIIFCEGPNLPWKLIIRRITENKNRFIFKFHGQNTHSVVGSYSSGSMGEVIEI